MLYLIGCSDATADAQKMIIPVTSIEIQLIGFVWFFVEELFSKVQP